MTTMFVRSAKPVFVTQTSHTATLLVAVQFCEVQLRTDWQVTTPSCVSDTSLAQAMLAGLTCATALALADTVPLALTFVHVVL